MRPFCFLRALALICLASISASAESEKTAAKPGSRDLPENVLAAARKGDGAAIQTLIDEAFAKDLRLDEDWATGLLNSLLDNREAEAFRTLLIQVRQTNLTKNWQPTESQLTGLIRDQRKDFVNILLASQLDPERLKKIGVFPDDSMKMWTIQQADAEENKRDGIRQLIEACRNGNVATVGQLLDAGVDVNGRSGDGHSWTPLTRAASAGKVDVVKVLLARGAEADLPKHPGWNYTPLCLTGSPEIADLLKEAGADVHAKLFRRDVSILTYVAMHNGAPMVQWFLDQGLDPKMIGDNNRTLLFSVKDGPTAELLLKAGIDPNHADEFGEVAIQTARGGDVVEALIKGGAKTTGLKHPLLASLIRENSGSAIEKALQVLPPQQPEDLQKALIAAAHMDRDKAAEVLLKNGAQANVEGEWAPGDSSLPLLICCIFGSEKTAKVLLARGADPNAGQIPGQMLRTALSNQHDDLTKILRDAGATGASDLCIAVATDNQEEIRRLMAAAPRFEESPDFWESVLETAAGKNSLEVVARAMEAGVPTIAGEGRDAYAAAAGEGHHETLAFLLSERGADSSSRDLKAALWNAVWNSRPYDNQRQTPDFEKCVRMLLDAGAPLQTEADDPENLIVAAVFTRNPGGNPRILEMLIAAGAEPDPVVADGKRLSEAIAQVCSQGGCSVPSVEILAVLEKQGVARARDASAAGQGGH